MTAAGINKLINQWVASRVAACHVRRCIRLAGPCERVPSPTDATQEVTWAWCDFPCVVSFPEKGDRALQTRGAMTTSTFFKCLKQNYYCKSHKGSLNESVLNCWISTLIIILKRMVTFWEKRPQVMYPCEYKAKKIAFAYFTSGRFFFFLWSSSSTGVSGETNGDIDSLAADEISCDSNAALFEMWEENQIEQQSSLRAAAATPSDTGVLHSESLCSILRALISFHEISCTAERDVGGAQRPTGAVSPAFKRRKRKELMSNGLN